MRYDLVRDLFLANRLPNLYTTPHHTTKQNKKTPHPGLDPGSPARIPFIYSLHCTQNKQKKRTPAPAMRSRLSAPRRTETDRREGPSESAEDRPKRAEEVI